jgi:predicted O-methyltransferase YrrM
MILLKFPFLYKLPFIYYETNIKDNKGIDELLFQLSKTLELEGNIIECGSSLCGSSIIIAKYINANKFTKRIYACDSFQGFDVKELNKERMLNLTKAKDNAFTITSYEYVQKKIEVLKLGGIVVPIKGYFFETIPNIIDKYCFIFIDCDLSESIYFCASELWPKLSKNGRIVFDDYNSELYKGAKVGIDKFINTYKNDFLEHGLMNRLYYVVKK